MFGFISGQTWSSTSCSRGQLLDGTKQSASLNSIGSSSLNPILPTSCLRYYNQCIKKIAKELNILVLLTLSPRPPASILTAVLLVCTLGTFLSVLLSSLVQKAVKRQKKLASFLMALLRLLYVVYIYTPTHSFYQ